MVETIRHWTRHRKPCGWNWVDIQHDLKKQGDLKEIVINPFSVSGGRCSGIYKGEPFALSWGYNNYASVSMATRNAHLAEELATGYAKVLEYGPFARYTQRDGKFITFEWRMNNPGAPLMMLRKRSDVSDLVVF